MLTQNYITPDNDQMYSRKCLDRRYGTIPLPSRLEMKLKINKIKIKN